MRSRSERWWFEGAAQAVGLVALALLAVRTPEHGDLRLRTRTLAQGLPGATRSAPRSLRISVDSMPGSVHRAWLGAIHRAGTPVVWEALPTVPPLAITVEPTMEPGGTMAMRIVAPSGAIVRDTVGELWPMGGSGSVESTLRSTAGLSVAAPQGTAHPHVPGDGRVPRLVRLYASAGWEGKFLADALRSVGWQVEVEFGVTMTPVRIGVRSASARAPVDTSTHAAVVVIGEVSPMPVQEIVAFVRSGGGLVIVDTAIGARAFAAIAPATALASIPPALGAFATTDPRRALAARALRLRPDGVAVERRGEVVTIAARREQLGRVVAVGYADTWRWRMEGPEGSLGAHAAWWSAIVASVTRAMPATTARRGDPAPLAAWHAALGAPASEPRSDGLPLIDERWLLVAALGAFTAAWVSRRTRGLP